MRLRTQSKQEKLLTEKSSVAALGNWRELYYDNKECKERITFSLEANIGW
jgi:hypothetical protein